MAKQIKIYELDVKNTMNINTIKELKGFKKGNFVKHQNHNIKFFKNNRIITCVISNKIGDKGVGVSKCHPNDSFNITYGAKLAEVRARVDFYKNISKNII
ncbi:hypothetical protein [Clostridium botulinum]|uniref:hypothetical protein n=1 Tax=Clostridium botulinum TaxID=1491 RepID=UPI0021FC6D95|nr:hypothetical protein [Clostridium botulinum]QDY27088.1 hypothetical protein CGQ40_20500 [Clostridium botulinum]